MAGPSAEIECQAEEISLPGERRRSEAKRQGSSTDRREEVWDDPSQHLTQRQPDHAHDKRTAECLSVKDDSKGVKPIRTVKRPAVVAEFFGRGRKSARKERQPNVWRIRDLSWQWTVIWSAAAP